ncbi:hypothetical protein ET495_12575 [Xylanimonas allomyrinae]|uniref:Putative zinc-finger domain-containing protein n=1 Tax=Xylanimonas allomyrinae TaxID=2509459 RepID=A0A4P6EU33_9MICO|nr:zf-HC2 domain-containing protein [Xylanimonas allomyrinae]QAY63927.1 hypothetical protein ET495_12575 [Xylanimonas allomyrinae]
MTISRDGAYTIGEALAAMRALAHGRAPGEDGTADPDVVRAALAGLGHDDQLVLWLRHVEVADDSTIADSLGVAPDEAQRRLRGAERALRSSFADVHARAAAHASGACAATRASLAEYVRHRVPSGRRRVLEEHLFGCQECMRAFVDVRQSGWAVRDAAAALLAGGAGLTAAGPIVAGPAGRRRRADRPRCSLRAVRGCGRCGRHAEAAGPAARPTV